MADNAQKSSNGPKQVYTMLGEFIGLTRLNGLV